MRRIQKKFPGVRALSGVALEARAGEAVALMGANGAGKSTLMNILGGVVEADSGEIHIDGETALSRSPIDARNQGIAFVAQELNSLAAMTIAENIFADAMPTRFGLIDRAVAHRRTAEILAQLGANLDPGQTMEDLGAGDRQLVEIARALRGSPRILIFDEPTSSLSSHERERLFSVIRNLKRSGAAIIYITHFIDEIFQICDRVTVLRNGETVFQSAIADTDPRAVVHEMMGALENEQRLVDSATGGDETLLEIRGLNVHGKLSEIDLTIGRGEIVGLWGLLGAGRTELIRALVGFDDMSGGAFHWRERDGRLVPLEPDALRARAGLVTEDRRGEGLLLPLSVSDNIVLPTVRVYSNASGLLDGSRQLGAATAMIERLGIRASSTGQQAGLLSGGNQQKVVFGKWLLSEPELFLLDEPTRGLDVGAKTEILKLIVELAAKGAGVLLISSELEELKRVCHRYVVMARGRITGELPGDAPDHVLLGALTATGQRPGVEP
jgi:ABC-type sugar transport system ATPase subunit